MKFMGVLWSLSERILIKMAGSLTLTFDIQLKIALIMYSSIDSICKIQHVHETDFSN